MVTIKQFFRLALLSLLLCFPCLAKSGVGTHPLEADIYPFGGTTLPLEFAADRGYDYFFQQELLSYLKVRGVMVFHLGHYVSIILPESAIFYPGTPNIRGGAYDTLRLVAAYLRFQPTEAIKVAGYTNRSGHVQQSIALSRQQAQNVAKMLWSNELDAPLIYAVGYGFCDPVALPKDTANRRIEITLRQF